MRSRLVILFLLVLAAATAVAAQTSKAAKIDKLVSGLAASGHFSGQVIASENGKIIYDKAFGLANADFKIPNATNTRIGIASITKPMTSVILFRLIEEGKIKLEDPLSKYIADFPSGDKITINMIHQHRSGILHRVMPPEMESVPVTSAEMVEKVKLAKLAFEPGTQRLYSSGGFAVLARVLEIASGKAYADMLKQYVFDPAGMKDSMDFVGGAIMERRAADYMLDADGYRSAALKDYSFLVGAGSVYGTAADVHRFGMAMIEGKYGESAKAAWVRDGVFSASGSTNGHRAYVEIKADKSYGFAMTSNLGTGAVDIVQSGVKEILEGREPVAYTVTVPKFDAAANPDLRKFTGKYKAANGGEIEIVNRGGHLYSSDIKLYSVKPGCFFDYRFFGEACFISEGDKIKELRWKGATFELTWARQ
ncbi:MAG TPA: serine hydrolase domain-containing protein [Pyrinomonadaceae bacterium]